MRPHDSTSAIATRKAFRWPEEPKHRFLSASQQAALLRLRYCIEHDAGCAVLAGVPGCGKSSVLRMLAEQPAFAPFVHITFPQLQPAEFLALVATEMSPSGQSFDASTHRLDTLIQSVRKSLLHYRDEDYHPVIAVDDAHLISDALLETIQSLLNLRDSSPQLRMSVILSGQPVILGQVMHIESLADRISITATMTGFTVEESSKFVLRELALAGIDTRAFDKSALDMIHQLSHGLPRRICRLGELAALLLQANDRHILDGNDISGIAQALLPMAA